MEAFCKQSRSFFITVSSSVKVISTFVENGFTETEKIRFGSRQGEYTSILKACGENGIIKNGMEMHDQIIRHALQGNVNIRSSLIDMYAKCGYIKESCNVFYNMSNHSVVVWGSMMNAYIRHGFGHQALKLYQQMRETGIEPDNVIYLCLLKACSNSESIMEGKLLHNEIIKAGFESDIAVGTTLLDMYAKCGIFRDAETVFTRIKSKNVVSWNALMLGYVRHGSSLVALDLFHRMQQGSIRPTRVTFLCIIRACARIPAVGAGRQVHNQAIINGFKNDLEIQNTLIDMYAKCESIEEARSVFDKLVRRDRVSWGAMLAGYVQQGYSPSAFALYEDMQRHGIKPDKVLFSCMLKACGTMRALELGKAIHDQIRKSRYENDVIIGNTLIDMYAKCGHLTDAREAFEKMPIRTEVSWGAMIAGYTLHGLGQPALELFDRMQEEGIKPNSTIFPCTFKACAALQSLEHGKKLHDQFLRCGIKLDVIAGNALVDMYLKCESLEDARSVFEELPVRDVISWSTIMTGYVQDGQGIHALELFRKLQEDKIKPDHALLLCVLKACSITGALEMGKLIHYLITMDAFDSVLAVKNSILDMYTKCESLNDAIHEFNTLMEKNVVSWNAMIAGYVHHGYSMLSLLCFQEMLCQNVKPDNLTFTIILNACCESGLVQEGYWYFKAMVEEFGTTPSIEHFNCMVDLLSRSGCLVDATELPQAMPVLPDSTTWMSLISACRMYGNRNVGQQCLDEVSQLKPDSAAAYTLLSHVYAEYTRDENMSLIKCRTAILLPSQTSGS